MNDFFMLKKNINKEKRVCICKEILNRCPKTFSWISFFAKVSKVEKYLEYNFCICLYRERDFCSSGALAYFFKIWHNLVFMVNFFDERYKKLWKQNWRIFKFMNIICKQFIHISLMVLVYIKYRSSAKW